MGRDSFVFYRSFYEALQSVPKKHRSEVYEAVFAYAFEAREPSLSGVPRALWELIRPQLDASQKRYDNAKKGAEYGKMGAEYGKRGGRPKKEKPPLRGNEQNPLNVNVNENVNDNENVNVSEGLTPDTAPTLEEVRAYCTERKNTVDPVRFVEYYQMREWKLSGGKRMKDWKAAVRYWETREKNKQPSGTKFSNFEGRQQSEEEMNNLIRAQYRRMVKDDGTHVKD